jgi:hypothetical protein
MGYEHMLTGDWGIRGAAVQISQREVCGIPGVWDPDGAYSITDEALGL